MDNLGWIWLHRKLLKWEWYKKPYMVHLFIHMILSANHDDAKWQGVDIKRGQLVTGRNSLSRDTGISAQSVRTCIERLKSTSEITIKSTSKYSIITITKYEEYNPSRKISTNTSTNKPTNNQPAINQQSTINNKNNKDNKKEKEEEKEISLSENEIQKEKEIADFNARLLAEE